ncbi:MAG: patatin-like phospholipase family protein [Bacteroidota bacterium]
MSSKAIHIVCSGGGVKTLSYIGAIQKLIEHGYTIASISGCSMGTFTGALVCSGMEFGEIEEKVINFDYRRLNRKKRFGILNLLKYPFAVFHSPDFSVLVKELFGSEIKLGDLKIPYAAAALDLRQRRFLVFSSDTHPDMKLAEVVGIANAVPIMHAPVEREKRLIVDAGLATDSPIWIAASRSENYPIVVLRIARDKTERYRKGLFKYVRHLISSAVVSHDFFALAQTPRAIEVNIDGGDIPYDDFSISNEKIGGLILHGSDAMDRKLLEYNYDLHKVLELRGGDNPTGPLGDMSKAEVLASNMIRTFQNESTQNGHVFISYHNKDTKWLQQLRKSLIAAQKHLSIDIWDDTMVPPGADLNEEMDKALANTKVAVFLVTANFLAASSYIDQQVDYFLNQNREQKVQLLWVAVSSSLHELTPIAKIDCANNPAFPLDQQNEGAQNKTITEISRKIIERMGL